eukprot:12570063-Heterocapsa_arctica.AAC.1
MAKGRWRVRRSHPKGLLGEDPLDSRHAALPRSVESGGVWVLGWTRRVASTGRSRYDTLPQRGWTRHVDAGRAA